MRKHLSYLSFLLVAIIALPMQTASAQKVSGESRYQEVAEKFQVFGNNLSMDATPVEFSIADVHYKVPRNYIVNMDNYKGGPQSLVAFRVSFPGSSHSLKKRKIALRLHHFTGLKGAYPLILTSSVSRQSQMTRRLTT